MGIESDRALAMEAVQFAFANKRCLNMYQWVRNDLVKRDVDPDETSFSAVVNLACELYAEEANDKTVGASIRMFPEKIRLIACNIMAEEMI